MKIYLENYLTYNTMKNENGYMFDEINKKITETIKQNERKCIKLESYFKKNNEIILKKPRDLLLKNNVKYKCVSFV